MENNHKKIIHAVYPGTFDPITNGHIDIVKRSLNLFDKVTIAVSTGYEKNTFFDIDQRVELIKKSFADYQNVEVISFRCLLVDLFSSINADVIIRGLRSLSDFEYEFQMQGTNKKLNKNIETIFLTPNDKYMFVSSSMVREVAKIDISRIIDFIPECVLFAIKSKQLKSLEYKILD